MFDISTKSRDQVTLVSDFKQSSDTVNEFGVDKLILAFLFGYLMIWSWLAQWGFDRIPIRILLMIMMLVRSAGILFKNKTTCSLIIAGCLVGISIAINVLMCGAGAHLRGNLLQLAYGYSVVVYFGCLVKYYRTELMSYLESNIMILDVYLLVNMLVTFRQLGETYFLINRSNVLNPIYEDLIAGFFGPNGTHRLTLFYCFGLVLNIRMLEKAIGARRLFFATFIAVTVIGYTYLATQSDNVMFIPIMTMSVVLLFVYEGRLKTGGIVALVVLLIMVFPILVKLSANEQLESFMWRLNFIFNSYSDSVPQNTENRIRIVRILLDEWNGLGLGSGMGGLMFYNDPRIDPSHYGMNSLQSLIGMGGITFYVIIILYYTLIINESFSDRSVLAIVSTLTVLLVTSYYTILVSQIYNLLPVLLTLFVCNCARENDIDISVDESIDSVSFQYA